MKKKYRKLYFILITSITLIAIPLLLLYSAGYRWDFGKNKVIKTGSLSASVLPKDAKLYINGDLRAGSSPILINNLIPGEYEISYQKDGYATWKKRLFINSRQTTFANNIILFKNNQPVKIHQDDFPKPAPEEIITTQTANIINELDLSIDLKIKKISNTQQIILDKKNKILYLIKEENNSLKIEKINQDVKDFSLNADQNKLLFINDLEIWSYNFQTAAKELITRQSETINAAIWLTDYYVIYSAKDKIKAIEIDSRDQQQTYVLAETAIPKNLSLDKKNKTLYFQSDNTYWQLKLFD